MTEPTVTVRKASAYVPVSFEMAIDCGMITEEEARAQGWTPTPISPPPWHWRLRWRIQNLRERAAAYTYRLIAGHEIERCDDD